MFKTTLSITTTYQPDLSQLEQQIIRLLSSAVSIIIIDNGSDNQPELAALIEHNYSGVKFLPVSQNQGIAFAQNLGIRFALKHNYQHVLLMDQDSLPAADMVSELHQAIQHYPDAAAVGPQFVDGQHQVRSRFIQVNGLRVNKNPLPDEYGCARVDHLIASGSLIPVGVFSQVGLMEEGLFIDYVDIEWALRARSKKLESYGVTRAIMHHSLGEGRVRVLGCSVARHSPLRHYYQVRNAVLLYQRRYIPLNWKIVDACKLLAKTFVSFLTSRQKKLEMQMIAKGFMHGVRNIKGRIS